MEKEQLRVGSRAASREQINTLVDARNGSRFRLEVIDVSVTGARLETYDRLVPGKTLWLKLPGLDALQCEIVWAHDFVSGCRFLRPIDPAVFADLVKSRSGGRSNRQFYAYAETQFQMGKGDEGRRLNAQ